MGQLVSLLVLSLRSRGEQALHDTRRASDGASFHAANLGHLDPHGGGPHSCQRMRDLYTLVICEKDTATLRRNRLDHHHPACPFRCLFARRVA